MVEVRAYPGRLFSGRIRRLGESMDAATRTLKVIVEVAAQGALKLAQTDPCPELLPVLNLLGSDAPYALPPECAEIRRELESLLARVRRPRLQNLPRPAAPPLQDAHNLPRPAKAE